MSRNNGRRGRGRGGANRGRNRQNVVAPPEVLDFGMSDPSSDSEDDIDLFTGLALIEALNKMRGRPGRSSRFGVGPDPGSGSDERIVYTEDDIPINTIYASFSMCPESATEATVRTLFEQLGPIKSVRIHTNQNNNMYDDGEVASGGGGRRGRSRYNRNERVNRYGFISYERCEDAAKCLQKKFLFKNKCYVAPADSWHQEAYHNKLKEAEEGAREGVDSSKNSDAAASSASGCAEGASVAPKASKADPNTSAISKTKISDVNGSEPGSMNILQLNDDCLMLICDYLELMDLLALKKTCSRFETISCEVFKRYKMLDFDIDPCEKKYLTMMDAKNILMEIGSYIEFLLISRDRFLRPGVRILNLIPRYCPNLKDLNINDFMLKAKTLKGFDEVFKSLEGLTLTACGIDDTILKSLKLATKLQRLNLSMNSEITGKCLASVKNLKYLNLESCQNIQGKPFSTFAAQNKTLEYLNITCCGRLTTEAIKSIVNNMTELRHLVCNNNYDNVDAASMALLGKLPNLKKLQFKINGYSPIDQILQGLTEVNKLEHLDLSEGVFTAVDYTLLSDLTHLKELKLNYKLDLGDDQLAKLCSKGNFVELHIAGCTKLTDKQLIEFIRKNPQLKLLDISYCQITEGLIFSAIDILREQAVGCREGSRQLKMMVGQTSICPVILNNTLVKANRHLLDVSFDHTEGFYGGMDSDDMYDDVMDDDDEDFMGYDYGDDDSLLWGLDYDSDLDFAEMCQYFYDSDDDDRYMYYM
ncbi:uncharacterized protein LOC135701169 isoform X3 [Ochlerotatus camptorhynchus]|uniref:uncharacterized protein LOC135701169 isoform X3 n=1 Tax=Ochlerotatus camptorhynchus TaxID=644619 RepID=UPI0031D2A762